MSSELPETIAPYDHHGVANLRVRGKNAQGDCPFCNAKRKFGISVADGRFNCPRCSAKGNVYTFLTMLHKQMLESTSPASTHKTITRLRGFKYPVELVKEAGLTYQDGCIIIPHSKPGKKNLVNIRRWSPKTRIAYNTPSMCTMMYLLWDEEGPVYVLEGEWDALSFMTLLSRAKHNYSKNPISVVAVPGAANTSTFDKKLFKGREVHLLYDFDHDKKRKNSKETFNPAKDGMAAVSEHLKDCAASVNCIDWNFHGEELPDGYDVTDYVKEAIEKKKSKLYLKRLLASTVRTSSSSSRKDVKVKPLPRTSFSEVVDDFKTRLEFKQSFEDVLACCFASVITLFMNFQKRNPLWMFIVGPASSGKTTIVEAFDAVEQYTRQLSRLTPASLVTGLNIGGDDDPSLLNNLRDTVLFIKDFTPVLTMGGDKEQIFGILRDAYDGGFVAHYASGKREYKNLFFGVVAGVTHAIEKVNMSDLGERFLRIRLLDETFDEEAHIEKALSNLTDDVGIENGGDSECNRTLLQGSVLGYINHLMANTYRPEYDHSGSKRLAALARLTALCRTEVPRSQNRDMFYRPSPEVASRIATQLMKLGLGLAMVYQRKSVDEECFRVMQRVALDSCTGWKLELIQILARNPEGMTIDSVAVEMQVHRNQVDKIVQDCMLLRIVRKETNWSNKRKGNKGHLLFVTDEVEQMLKQCNLFLDQVEVRRATPKKGVRTWRKKTRNRKRNSRRKSM